MRSLSHCAPHSNDWTRSTRRPACDGWYSYAFPPRDSTPSTAPSHTDPESQAPPDDHEDGEV